MTKYKKPIKKEKNYLELIELANEVLPILKKIKWKQLH